MEAYLFLREKNQSIPSETLDFMKDASLAEFDRLNVKQENQKICKYCGMGAQDYPEIGRRTCPCGGLGYNVKD